MLGYRPLALTTLTPSKPSVNRQSLLIGFSDIHVCYMLSEAPEITTVTTCYAFQELWTPLCQWSSQFMLKSTFSPKGTTRKSIGILACIVEQERMYKH